MTDDEIERLAARLVPRLVAAMGVRVPPMPDGFVARVRAALDGRERATVREVLGALDAPASRSAAAQVGLALRALGWSRCGRVSSGRRERVYAPSASEMRAAS